jgi:hypothetical protein
MYIHTLFVWLQLSWYRGSFICVNNSKFIWPRMPWPMILMLLHKVLGLHNLFLRPLAAYSHPIPPNTLSAKIHLKSTLSSFILRNCSLGIQWMAPLGIYNRQIPIYKQFGQSVWVYEPAIHLTGSGGLHMTRLATDVHHKNANQPFFPFSPNLGCGISDKTFQQQKTHVMKIEKCFQ